MKTTHNKLIGLLATAVIGLTLSSCGGGGGGDKSDSSDDSYSSKDSSSNVSAPAITSGDKIRITVSSTVVEGFSLSDTLTIISSSQLKTGIGATGAYTYTRNGGASATFSYTTSGIHQSFGSAAATIYKTLKAKYELTFTSSTTAKVKSITYETAIGGTVTEKKTTSGSGASFTIL